MEKEKRKKPKNYESRPDEDTTRKQSKLFPALRKRQEPPAPPPDIETGSRPVASKSNRKENVAMKPSEDPTLVQVKSSYPNQETKYSEKSVDFVLVYLKDKLNQETSAKISYYIVKLKERGFKLETSPLSVNDNIYFIKLHAPRQILLRYAEVFGIELGFLNTEYTSLAPIPFHFMATELTMPNFAGPVFPRAPATILGGKPVDITTAERGLIIYKMLTITSFGPNPQEKGIEKLLKKKIIESAFPLHDGPCEWSEEGPLNDRQLLKKYWSPFKLFYKQQPLNTIERYYGPETAFYFAWLGFYNKMLIPASIIGILCFFLGVMIFLPSFKYRTKEVCLSQIYLCPRCIVKNCKYSRLRSSCFHAYMILLFDNPVVVTFAALMSIWSTVFMELWRREEAMLQIRWNLRSVEVDYSMRPDYEENTKHRKYSKITDSIEPYMPKRELCWRHSVTASIILLLIGIVVLAIMGVMIYVKTVTAVLTQAATEKVVVKNVGLMASVTGSLISVCFILTFEQLYRRVALWLTNLENPRTQVDFDNSYTYKTYALAFVNYYSVIFYIAFMKARFYTYPGDKALWERLGGLGADLCDPAGCMVELGIQMMIVLLAKNLLLTAKQFIVPQLLIFVNKIRKKLVDDSGMIKTQWESDYLLNQVTKYQLMDEYMSMIIQYGFVTFFVAAFPLAPLFALLNNLIELRVDALKFTSAYTRPVAHKVATIAAWNGILQCATYIGVATNAFVIAFTSELVPRTLYTSHSRPNLEGYINWTLSVFNTSEFPGGFKPDVDVPECAYPGKRYPPSHKKRYELTDDHWMELTMQFLAVVLFEHIVMLITGIIAYAIPDIPFSVKEHINYRNDQLKENKLKTLHTNYLKKQSGERIDVFQSV